MTEQLLRAARDASPLDRAGIAPTLGGWGVPVLLDDEHPAGGRTAGGPAPAARHEVEVPPRRGAAAAHTTFGEIADEAVAIARMTNAHTVDHDGGRC
ncbi:hypothetical protein JNUCC0626_46475 [Lentzea sp. JNUCC 0626]|uniref:hypothetical protein n=1 Tax=Lentzea sp. JNUCC 0626 TaxID=3367513 RepID=UPI00374862BF